METVEAEVRQFATQTNLFVWEGIPWGGATTLTPESQTLADFLAVARAVGAPILYLDPDGSAAAFAANGVVHVFATPAERLRLTGGDSADDEDLLLNEDEDQRSGSVTIRVGGSHDYNDPYYDWQSGRKVSGRVREAVDALVADGRFNGYRSGHVVAEYVAELEAEDADAVERVARRVFEETVGKQLDHQATQLVQTLVKDPAYDPLAWGPENRAFIEERVENEDLRLLERLERALATYAHESGARTKAERELARRAEAILLALTPAERDRLGFASRNAAKLQVLAPHLKGESNSKADRLAKEVARLEQERFGLPREERYATAARHLQASGMTRAEVSRRLGISNSIVERIVATHRRDVELTSDDPIRVDLAPDFF
ncbi:hypothetical protein ACQE98_12720 [Ornithinimicrobium sp. W1679]|uniref:hypothetical protein n=1 Tax=Ornithinimicrobium sp. W1679 TaxID=3418770 RepID=UPI003CF99DF7